MCAMAFEYAARFLKQGSLNISKYENQIFKNNNVGYEILCTILLKYAKTQYLHFNVTSFNVIIFEIERMMHQKP